MKKLLVLVLALLAVACVSLPKVTVQSPVVMSPAWYTEYTHNAPDPTWNTIIFPYYVDKRFGTDRKAQIKLAVDEWNYALNGRFVLRFVDDSHEIDSDFVDAHSDFDTRFFIYEDAADPLMELWPGVLAYVPELGAPDIHLIDQRLDFTFMPEVVIMHEMGHSFGLEHMDIHGTLMTHYYTDQPHCIDQVAVRTLAYQMDWDYRTLNWCQ